MDAATAGDGATSAGLVLRITVAAFVIGELTQSFRRRRGSSRPNITAEAVFRAVFFVGILLLPLGRLVAPSAQLGGGVRLFIVGAVVAWLGLALRWWSFVTLGSYFTFVVTASADQPVVDRGPYRVLRHPSYTGLLLAVMGCGIMLGNWAGLASSTALILFALVYRIRIEERTLTSTLGDAYRSFAGTRARLVPFLW